MPVRPQSLVYRCPACGWSKTVTPKSDALLSVDAPARCPSCGHAPLEVQQAGPGVSLLSQLGDVLERWRR